MKALNSYRTKNRNLETGVEMEKYSVLLVDDEEDVIQIIMKKMDWESMGFQIVGYAHNGVEALEMAEELQPDVVMTDIKMPYMDGLTLSRKLKELYRTVKIIIFSGFDEFEYAKEAIQIEVEEYILKPIDAGNLKEVFGRIHEKIGREMDEKRNVDKLREYYMESLPILQENFYTSLIDGRIPEGEVEKYLSNYQIDLTGPCYVVSILHISTTDIPQNMNPFLLGVSVKKLAEEHMEGEWKSRILMYLGDIVVITQLEEQEQITAFTDFMDKFCRLAKHVCEATVTAGIGYVCDNLPDIRLSWQGARSAVSYRVSMEMRVRSILRKLILWRMWMNVGRNRKYRRFLKESVWEQGKNWKQKSVTVYAGFFRMELLCRNIRFLLWDFLQNFFVSAITISWTVLNFTVKRGKLLISACRWNPRRNWSSGF